MSLLQFIEHHYATNDGPSPAHYYHEREGTKSACILTLKDLAEAKHVADLFRHEITGKIVAEIGAGVGMLSFEMASSASRVWAIENDPAWTYGFAKFLYRTKPANLHWIFAPAEQLAFRVDVAVIRTCSGAKAMLGAARHLAPRIIISIWDGYYVGDSDDPKLDYIASYLDARRNDIINNGCAEGEGR